MAKEIFYFDCMNCGHDWDQKLDAKAFMKELKKGDWSSIGENGACPECRTGDIAIGNDDGMVWSGSAFEAKKIFDLKKAIAETIKVDESNEDVVKYLTDYAKSLDSKMSNDAKKGKKLISKMAGGTYELIADMTSEYEIETYADESSGLSASDVGYDEDDDEWQETVDTWDMVGSGNNPTYIAAFNDFNQNNNEEISKIILDAVKKISSL